ncbi:SpoIIE family protein phosphatase [Frankia sp. AgB32]|uniref:ATP-binding SpoIIE family protein phosphatase n=1 Tax=Frankia sp. AgB32 TaxID=631119 RepID=UPI00200E8021|nr:SpoIIE family protein phosphatase [Frankia sp. AgB32]MCK9896817.1 SpoIIE family protein phosphatase [Frankia sp. AgB32]
MSAAKAGTSAGDQADGGDGASAAAALTRRARASTSAGLRTARGFARTLFGRPRTVGRERAAGSPSAFLADAALVLGETLDPDRVVSLLADLALPRFGSTALVWLREGDTPRLGACLAANPRAGQLLRAMIAASPPRLTDEFPPGLVLRTGQVFCVSKVGDLRPALSFSNELAYRRFGRIQDGPIASVPLAAGGEVIGVLTVGRPEIFYSNAEIALLEDLARHGSLALHNALRFREAQESALTLQRSLLPAHPPALDGVEIAMEYRPGTAGTEVGGDFYDVIPLSGGRVGVAIGDVMGRGLRAAAVMGQLRAALRAYALEDWGPAEVLSRLDRVVGLLPGLQLATCMYAVYDRHTGRAVIANAGHLAPLVILPDEDPDYLVLDPGLPLGVADEGADFCEMTVTLPPGSALVMFTDGLVESRRRPLEEGLRSLRSGLIEQRAWVAAARGAGATADGAAAPADAAGETPNGAAAAEWVDRRAPGPSLGPPPGMPDRRSGRDRRGGQRRHGGAERRRRTRGGSFAVRSWFGPDAIDGAGEGPTEETARSLVERCLLAADLPARTDDDTALVALTTLAVNPPLLELALPAVGASAGQARMAIRTVLVDCGIVAVDDATLLVSEVVTNAVLHARSDLVLRAYLEPGRLRISVEDREGAHLPRPGAAAENRPDPESGWGLLLVEALSLAWGVESTAGGKRVWFDIEVPERTPGAGPWHSPAQPDPPAGSADGRPPPDPPAQSRGRP